MNRKHLFVPIVMAVALLITACAPLATPTPTPTMPPLKPQDLIPGQSGPKDIEAIEQAAQTIASEELGVSPDEVTVMAIEEVQWSDSSLGCPQPGYMYAQVITPGYKILVKVKGQEYAVHTDARGRGVVCLNKD
ncbi:MAG: hypothetical protein GXP42_01330 [Chloroflexi bacterium]|nr:hypothetical protein [Chloroflexota bacterium]